MQGSPPGSRTPSDAEAWGLILPRPWHLSDKPTTRPSGVGNRTDLVINRRGSAGWQVWRHGRGDDDNLPERSQIVIRDQGSRHEKRYFGKFMRRPMSWKRGSERSESQKGSALSETMKGSRSWKDLSSQFSARAVSPAWAYRRAMRRQGT